MSAVNLADYVYYDETSPTLLRRSPNKLSPRFMWRAHQPIGGGHSGQGYKMLGIHGVGLFYIHRVVWELHNGPIPKNMVVDHKDRDRLNNKIDNLRCVTRTANATNATPRPNKHGYSGVSYDKRDRRYYAVIRVTENGKSRQLPLGNYATAVEANQAYLAKKRELYPCSDIYEKTKTFEPGLASMLMFC